MLHFHLKIQKLRQVNRNVNDPGPCQHSAVRFCAFFLRRNRQLSPVAEPGLSRTPGRVLSIDVHKLTVQKIHENINGKIDNIQKAPSRSNIFILLQQLIQVQR